MNNVLTPQSPALGDATHTASAQNLPVPDSAWANNTPVFLVGMMGAGKTTIGKSLAKALQREFLDLDHELEARCGVRIPTILRLKAKSVFVHASAKC